MGLIDNEFIFNNVSSKDFNIFCSGVDNYAAPLRQYEGIEIAGKNGLVLRDKKCYHNSPAVYKCIIYNNPNDYERFKAFMMSQAGYKRLEDSFHPDEFRIAAVADAIEPKVKGNDYELFSFEITFSCKPQRFLKDGEKTYTINTSGQLINNTYYEALPLLRVYQNGTITINNKTLTCTNVSGYVDIDCEEMDAYKGSVNMNNYISGDFPVLKPGINAISCTGTVDIKPRWWTL